MLTRQNVRLLKDVLKMAGILTLAIFLCRITAGYFSLLMAALGAYWAITRSVGKAIACFAFFPFLIVLSPGLLPKTAILGYTMRLSPLAIGSLLCVLAISRGGANRLPLGSLFLYLACACISSATGWHAYISYMKIVNFVLFFIGIWMGTQNLQRRPADVYFMRRFFLGLIFVIVVGSLIVLPFPNISYSTSLGYGVSQDAVGAAVALAELRMSGGVALFSGALNHSQALAPVLSCCLALLLADMFFIEKRKTSLHLALLALASVELFMTRSRTGLLSGSVGLFMMLVYAPKHLSVTLIVRRRIRQMTSLSLGVLVVVVLVGEISTGMFSRWLLKTNDSERVSKEVGYKDAVTGTRQILIEMSLDEFRRNPMFGMGFQVNFETEQLYGGQKFVLSAPVEKGLLVTTILGEGGIVGSIAFGIFLIMFYVTCVKRKLVLTLSMFTVFMATNVGEATFFSPGGVGGIIWVLCVVAGFSFDTFMLCERQFEHWGKNNVSSGAVVQPHPIVINSVAM